MKILLLGGLCIDETLECDHIPQVGQDVLIKSKTIQLGGSCLNVATILKRLNKEAILYSALSKDCYSIYTKQISNEGFDLSCIYKMPEKTGTCTILIDSSKERTFLTFNGIEGHFDESRISQKVINEIDWIYLSGIFLTYENSNAISPFLRKMCKLNKKIFFDLGSLIENIDRKLLSECVALATIIKGNQKEIEILCERLSISHIQNCICNNTEIIIETRGSEGSLTTLIDRTIETKSIKIEAVDTTGSGDNFVGAFLSATLDGKSIEDCLEIASKYGALATLHPGGRIPLI